MDSDSSKTSPFSIRSNSTSNKPKQPSKLRFETKADNQHQKPSSLNNKGKPKPLDFSTSIYDDTTRTLKRHWQELQNNIKKAITGNEPDIHLIESPYDDEYTIANEFIASPTKMTRAQLNLAQNVIEILERLTINSHREKEGPATQSNFSRLNSIIEQLKLSLSDSNVIDKRSMTSSKRNDNIFIESKAQNNSDRKSQHLFQPTFNSPTYRDNFKKPQPRYTLLGQLILFFLYRGGYHLIRTAITLFQIIKLLPVQKFICFLESKFLTTVLVICLLLRFIRSYQAKA